MPQDPIVQAPPPSRRRRVKVRLNGKEYRVVTDADPDWLQDVADKVDEAMAHVRDRTETVDSLDIAVLTALNLARELMILKEQGVTAPGTGATLVFHIELIKVGR